MIITIKLKTNTLKLFKSLSINQETSDIKQAITNALFRAYNITKDFPSFEVLNFEAGEYNTILNIKGELEGFIALCKDKTSSLIECHECGEFIENNNDCNCDFNEWFDNNYYLGDFEFEDLNDEKQEELKEEFEDWRSDNLEELEFEEFEDFETLERVLNNILNKHGLNVEDIKKAEA